MKKILFLLLCLCVLIGVIFAAGAKGRFKKIGLSVPTLNNPFFVTLVDEAKQKATELGHELLVQDAQNDPNKQFSDIKNLIKSNVAVILITPTDSDAIISAIKFANKKGVPVITVERSANGGTVATHVASDNVAGGKMAGEYLLSLVGAHANVVELEGVPGTSTTIDRGQGFNAAIKGKLNVVAKQTVNFNRAEGLSVMENILQSKPTIKGVFAHNNEMALGALSAIQAAGKTSIIVVGFGANEDAVQSVRDGKIATVAQNPALIGSLSVEAADKIINGQAVDTKVNVEFELVKY